VYRAARSKAQTPEYAQVRRAHRRIERKLADLVRWHRPTGSITSTTKAVSNVGDADEKTFYSTSVNPSLLVTGTNVLALEIHQRNADSSDLSFDLQLVGSASGSALAAATIAVSHTAHLTDAQLQPILAAASDRWAAAGLDAAALAKLHSATVVIRDLGGSNLGMAYAASHLIRIDDDAAGHGWFVDPTPWDDAEFATPGNQGEQHRMDLLTAPSSTTRSSPTANNGSSRSRARGRTSRMTRRGSSRRTGRSRAASSATRACPGWWPDNAWPSFFRLCAVT
jgi:hypothetical protein